MLKETISDALRNKIIGHDIDDSCPKVTLQNIGIPTCSRPEALHRCVTSFLDNCRIFGRGPRVVVVDDSEWPSQQAANVACLEKLSTNYPESTFAYAGLAEKRRYSNMLIHRSGVDPSIIEFALFNPENLRRKACGPNRNALFLEMVGQSFMSLDDDVVCRPSVSAALCKAIEITSARDPTKVSLFQDEQTLLSQTPHCNLDVLALHENVLGKSIGTLAKLLPEMPITFAHAKQALRDRLEKSPMKARISWSGIYGDPGARYPTYYLWKDESTYEQITASEEAYRKLSVSRQIFRAPGCLTLGSGGYCQSTALAYDHSVMLPPYMPLRGLDIIFGQILASCFKDAVIAYLPSALLHAPNEIRRNSARDISQSGSAVSYHCVLQALIEMHSHGADENNEVISLASLGAHLCDLGALPINEFERVLQRQVWMKIERRINRLNRQIKRFPEAPVYWSTDVRACIQGLSEKMTESGLRRSLLAEESDLITEERLRLTQRLTGHYGALLRAWPALLETAAELRRGGIALGRTMG